MPDLSPARDGVAATSHTLEEWTSEINKMRNTFGAPLPPDQVGILAKYLVGIDGRQQPPGLPSTVDGQGS